MESQYLIERSHEIDLPLKQSRCKAEQKLQALEAPEAGPMKKKGNEGAKRPHETPSQSGKVLEILRAIDHFVILDRCVVICVALNIAFY